VGLTGLRQGKFPINPSGIESTTFRFVAQYLDQLLYYATLLRIKYEGKLRKSPTIF
jgi:hypothetical protein